MLVVIWRDLNIAPNIEPELNTRLLASVFVNLVVHYCEPRCELLSLDTEHACVRSDMFGNI